MVVIANYKPCQGYCLSFRKSKSVERILCQSSSYGSHAKAKYCTL